MVCGFVGFLLFPIVLLCGAYFSNSKWRFVYKWRARCLFDDALFLSVIELYNFAGTFFFQTHIFSTTFVCCWCCVCAFFVNYVVPTSSTLCMFWFCISIQTLYTHFFLCTLFSCVFIISLYILNEFLFIFCCCFFSLCVFELYLKKAIKKAVRKKKKISMSSVCINVFVYAATFFLLLLFYFFVYFYMGYLLLSFSIYI